MIISIVKGIEGAHPSAESGIVAIGRRHKKGDQRILIQQYSSEANRVLRGPTPPRGAGLLLLSKLANVFKRYSGPTKERSCSCRKAIMSRGEAGKAASEIARAWSRHGGHGEGRSTAKGEARQRETGSKQKTEKKGEGKQGGGKYPIEIPPAIPEHPQDAVPSRQA